MAAPAFQPLATPEGVRYLRAGRGSEPLLIVNAFGLTLAFWHELVASLAERFSVLTLADGSDDDHGDGYYAEPSSGADFTAQVKSVLAAEGLASCHVASWCAGAKLAIELAGAAPAAVRSLALFAPSFAGIAREHGADSAFEANLHTMCKLVDKMPASAESMAKSMMALLQKDAGSDTQHQARIARPFSSAARMTHYSRQLLHFRAHHPVAIAEGRWLELPALLVTGEADTATCSLRAKDICASLLPLAHFELRGGDHYFIARHAGAVAALLLDFVQRGLDAASADPVLQRAESADCVVAGEI